LPRCPIDQLLGVAGKRRHDRDFVVGEEPGEVFLARLEEHREVAAVDHVHAEAARRAHQVAKVRVQLRRAAGDVERRGAAGREIFEQVRGRFSRHRLRARGAGVDMAVQARLVAHVSHVDLHGLEARAAQRREIGFEEEWKRGMHDVSLD
jgi:putative IMPACT (imprinted ancient) family translation regulator